jgi:hypothetical protein
MMSELYLYEKPLDDICFGIASSVLDLDLLPCLLSHLYTSPKNGYAFIQS